MMIASLLRYLPPLVTIYFFSELLVFFSKRKPSGAENRDQGSLQMLMPIFGGSIFLSWFVMALVPQAQMGALQALSMPSCILFFIGLLLRWYAVIRLGRFFTVEVSILDDHKLIDDGLFRFVRHPSYMGLLLMLLAIGIRTGNLLALVSLLLPTGLALLYRIRIEEAALLKAFGSSYVEYAAKTKRLVPYLY
jgi:protein-S-isoprenylcysteine O-methyltransferase